MVSCLCTWIDMFGDEEDWLLTMLTFLFFFFTLSSCFYCIECASCYTSEVPEGTSI